MNFLKIQAVEAQMKEFFLNFELHGLKKMNCFKMKAARVGEMNLVEIGATRA